MAFTNPQLNRAQEHLHAMGSMGFRLSAATLAKLCEISTGYLSNGFRGLTKVPSNIEQRIVGTTSLLKDVSDAAYPLLLPNDANNLGRILKFVRKNDITAGAVYLAISSVFGDFRNQ
jgi:hypothetical protein